VPMAEIDLVVVEEERALEDEESQIEWNPPTIINQ